MQKFPIFRVANVYRVYKIRKKDTKQIEHSVHALVNTPFWAPRPVVYTFATKYLGTLYVHHVTCPIFRNIVGINWQY